MLNVKPLLAAAATAFIFQNEEHTGDAVTYAKDVQRTARLTEFLGLKILGPPAAAAAESQQAAASEATSRLEQSSSSSSSSSSDGGNDDAFLRFTVRWRQRGVGGPEEFITETSHFKRVNGAWLYYAQVE
jgi:uncharacterized protein YchJ